MNKTIEEIMTDLVTYYTEDYFLEDYTGNQKNIIDMHKAEWDFLDYVPEDATTEQEQEKDSFLRKVAEEVSTCKKYYIIATRVNLDGFPSSYTIGYDNNATSDYENIMFFDTEAEAQKWIGSSQAAEWKDCTFEVVADEN